MKKSTRRISLLLSAAMMLGSAAMPVTAVAEEEKPVVKLALPYIVELTKLDEITEKVNAIVEEETGCTLEFVPIDFSSYGTQMNMILSTDENLVDAFHTLYSFTLSSLVANGQVMALDDLVEEYGQGIAEAVGEDYLNCGRIDGTLYTLPNVGAYSDAMGYIIKKDIAEELEINPEEITTLDQLTDVMIRAKELYPEMDVIPTSAAGWTKDYTIDNLCDENNLGVLMDYGKELKVENYYATERYKELCEYGQKWQEAELFTEDPLNNTNGTMAEVSSGLALGCFSDRYSAYANVMDYQSMFGFDIVAFKIDDAIATTQGTIHNSWCITATCENPEATMKVLNVLYTNPEVSSLLCYGVEDETYVLNEDGQASYAEGVDMFTAGWGTGMTFFWPNPTIAVPFAPQTSEYWEDVVASNSECIQSGALGFTFNADPVADEVTACTNVVNQYHLSLMAGIVDYEDILPMFLSALESAGIDRIVEEKQRQLDEWAAAQE